MASSTPPTIAAANPVPINHQLIFAVAALDDLATIRTHPEIIRLRSELAKHSYPNCSLADSIAQTYEISGICRTVANRYPHGPHYHHAHLAYMRTHFLVAGAEKRFGKRESTIGAEPGAAGGADAAAFREFLRTHLAWVHEYGTLDDGALDGAASCLSPATAYLQMILCSTPVEEWAAALSPATAPDASPLSFALALARRSLGVGRQTADVALLVVIANRILCLMSEQRETERQNMSEQRGYLEWANSLAPKGPVTWMAKRYFPALAILIQTPRQHEQDCDDVDELVASLRSTEEGVARAGDRYAQLLGKADAAEERKRIVVSIRQRVLAILLKAKPAVPIALLNVVEGLAAGEE